MLTTLPFELILVAFPSLRGTAGLCLWVLGVEAGTVLPGLKDKVTKPCMALILDYHPQGDVVT